MKIEPSSKMFLIRINYDNSHHPFVKGYIVKASTVAKIKKVFKFARDSIKSIQINSFSLSLMKKGMIQTLCRRLFDWLQNLILIAGGCFMVWLLLVVTTFSSFKVPTGSMEPDSEFLGEA